MSRVTPASSGSSECLRVIIAKPASSSSGCAHRGLVACAWSSQAEDSAKLQDVRPLSYQTKSHPCDLNSLAGMVKPANRTTTSTIWMMRSRSVSHLHSSCLWRWITHEDFRCRFRFRLHCFVSARCHIHLSWPVSHDLVPR